MKGIIAGIALVLVISLLIALFINWAKSSGFKAHALCSELGGKLIVTKGYGSHCIDKSVFIDLNGGAK